MLANIYILWISLLPLITWGGRYEVPKVIYFLTGGLTISFFWIYRVLFKKKNFGFVKSDIFYFLWLTVLTISSIRGVDPFQSIVGGSYRHQGVIFFFIIWLTAKVKDILSYEKKKFLYRMVALGILVESLVIIIQYLTGRVYFGKPLGTIGEANAVGGFLAIGSYFLYQSFPKISVILPFTAIIMTTSRTAILTLFINSGIFIQNLGPKIKKFIWAMFVILALVLLITFSYSKPYSFFEDRHTFLQLGLKKVAQNPLLGYGAESNEIVYKEAFLKIGFPLENLIVDRSHNLFLDVAIWSGGLGLYFFILWLYFNFRTLKDPIQKFAFISFLVYSFFQPVSIVHWILFFLFV